MKLAFAEIQRVASNAGFTGEDLQTAVAIALAESGGDPGEYDAETEFFREHSINAIGRGSCGLWQIFRFEHPEFDGWNLDDPQVNAYAASIVYHRAGKMFTPWSTFSSGKYRNFLPEASGT